MRFCSRRTLFRGLFATGSLPQAAINNALQMNLLGTLNVAERDDVECEDVEKMYNTFNVNVSVKKPDFEVLKRVEKAAMILLIFEAVFTLAVIGAVRNWYCVLFVIPALFRYAAFPTSTSSTYMLPSFVLLHSMMLAAEAIITTISAIFTYQVLGWNGEYVFLSASLSALAVVLFVRFFLAVIQQKHYNRIWMSHILSDRSFFFNLE